MVSSDIVLLQYRGGSSTVPNVAFITISITFTINKITASIFNTQNFKQVMFYAKKLKATMEEWKGQAGKGSQLVYTLQGKF